MNKHKDPQEDMIDLREYLAVMIKRKKLVLIVFLASVIIAKVVGALAPKTYEISSTIQLGSIGGPLINKAEAWEIIVNQNFLSTVIKEINIDCTVDELKKSILRADIGNTDSLRVYIMHPDKKIALKINDAILKPVIAYGQSIYRERFDIYSRRIKELDAAIENAEQDIARTQSLILSIANSRKISPAESALEITVLQNTLPEYENNLTNRRNQRNDLQLLLAASKDFKILEAPIVPEHPVNSGKVRFGLIAGIFSLLIGITLVFFMESRQKGAKIY